MNTKPPHAHNHQLVAAVCSCLGSTGKSLPHNLQTTSSSQQLYRKQFMYTYLHSRTAVFSSFGHHCKTIHHMRSYMHDMHTMGITVSATSTTITRSICHHSPNQPRTQTTRYEQQRAKFSAPLQNSSLKNGNHKVHAKQRPINAANNRHNKHQHYERPIHQHASFHSGNQSNSVPRTSAHTTAHKGSILQLLDALIKAGWRFHSTGSLDPTDQKQHLNLPPQTPT